MIACTTPHQTLCVFLFCFVYPELYQENTAEHRLSFPCTLRMLLNETNSYLVEKTTRTKENRIIDNNI